MARAKELSEQISDITECSICSESFKDPKVLPCIHTFCLHCLEKYGQEKETDPGDKVDCPLCRKMFTIPQTGFNGLPNNYFIIQLLQVSLQQPGGGAGENKGVQCEPCSSVSQVSPAAGYCIECGQHICKMCIGRHKVLKFAKTHKVVNLDEKPAAEELMKMMPSYCEQHPISYKTETQTVNGEVLSAAVLLTHPTIHQVINSKTGVRGIGVSASEIFVGGDKSTQIDVYDIKTFSLTRKIQIPCSAKALALVACSHNNCLYVSTTNAKSIIHRFDLSNNSSSQWPLSGKCCGLSVTRNFNLIVTLRDERLIQEYTTQGNLIREIIVNITDAGLVNPHHSVQLSSGEFVVCLVGSEGQKVSIVDSTGQVIKSYGGPKGSGDGQLDRPFQLSVDKFDNVIVADHGNNRIVLLSPTLTLLGYIPTPGNKLDFPYPVHVDAMMGYLFIGEFTSGRVLVLKASDSRQ